MIVLAVSLSKVGAMALATSAVCIFAIMCLVRK